MTPLPSPQQLRYLTSLAELRHFGRAAIACSVTQSTLSAGILALERQLDAALLDRGAGRQVVFTPAGREVADRAQRALAALRAVSEAATEAREPAAAGSLRLGVIPTVAPFLLPRLLPALRDAVPGAQPELNEDLTHRLLDKLAQGRLDSVLLALPCDCEGTETRALARDPLLAALPEDHPLARHQAVRLQELQRETMLLLEDGHCLRDQVLDACRQAERPDSPEPPRFAATSLQTVVQMVENGLGVTLLPRLAVRSGLCAGARVALRPLAGAAVFRTLGLAWRPGSARRGGFDGLCALLEDRLREPDSAAAT